MKSAASVMTDLSYSNHLPLLGCRLLRRKLATIRETTLQHTVELALDLVQAAQDQEELLAQVMITNQIRNARKRLRPLLLAGPQLAENCARPLLSGRVAGGVISPTS